jgi:uncharacterized protein YjbI with pentapeptide repeats
MWYLYNTEGGEIWSSSDHHASAKSFIQAALDVGISFSHVDLTRTLQQWPTHVRDLSHMMWSDQDLTSAHMMHVNFSHGVFHRCILRDCLATHATFTSCDFSGAILDAGSFEFCDFSDSQFDVTPQVGVSARHPLRPQLDEFLPFDRVLARSVNFAHAQFERCVFVHVLFTAAQFEHVNFSCAIMEHCNFEGVLFQDTIMVNCMLFNCELITTTLCKCITSGACFRGNEYYAWPMPKVITRAAWKFPRQLCTYVQEELAHWRRMGTEVKQDYKRQVMIKFMIMVSVPVMVLIAWKYVETNWVISMVTAVGAMSTWALRRYFTMIMQAGGSYILGRVNQAEGLWRLGHRREALLSLVSARKVNQQFKQRMKSP